MMINATELFPWTNDNDDVYIKGSTNTMADALSQLPFAERQDTDSSIASSVDSTLASPIALAECMANLGTHEISTQTFGNQMSPDAVSHLLTTDCLPGVYSCVLL
jgi:pyridoxine/pyridoxamine 5'-phosphate oxidase